MHFEHCILVCHLPSDTSQTTMMQVNPGLWLLFFVVFFLLLLCRVINLQITMMHMSPNSLLLSSLLLLLLSLLLLSLLLLLLLVVVVGVVVVVIVEWCWWWWLSVMLFLGVCWQSDKPTDHHDAGDTQTVHPQPASQEALPSQQCRGVRVSWCLV